MALEEILEEVWVADSELAESIEGICHEALSFGSPVKEDEEL